MPSDFDIAFPIVITAIISWIVVFSAIITTIGTLTSGLWGVWLSVFMFFTTAIGFALAGRFAFNKIKEYYQSK